MLDVTNRIFSSPIPCLITSNLTIFQHIMFDVCFRQIFTIISFLFLFFCLRGRLPSLPRDFTVCTLHSDSVRPQSFSTAIFSLLHGGGGLPDHLGSNPGPLPQQYGALPCNEPPHLQQWATTSPQWASTSPTMSHHISNNEPPHLPQWAATSPTISHHISNNEPPHLQQLATTSPTMSHHISPMSHHISHELLFCYHKIF